MKPINRELFSAVGYVAKHHATKGELKLVFNAPVKLKEWVFLELREKPVPFFIEFKRAVNNNEWLVKLEQINSVNDALTFAGKTVLMPIEKPKKIKDDLSALKGFKVIDTDNNFEAVVTDILVQPMQTLLVCTYNLQEVLIPVVEDFILEIKPRKKEIYMSLPEGLIHINH